MSKILIVSPDFNLVTMMEARLLMDGYEVFTADDGLSGFQKVRELKPHLIILDAALPKMSGHQLAGKVKAVPDIRRIPVIVIADQAWVRDLFREEDVFYFCPKPVLYIEFIGKVVSAINSVETEKTLNPQEEDFKPSPGRGRILLAGAQEFILKKVREFFVSQGFTVEMSWDENDLIRKAETMKPDYIFIQFWEDIKVFNARKVENSLAKKPELRALPLYVFCHQRLVSDVRDFVPHDHAIPFVESSDLLAGLQKALSNKKKRP